MRIKPTMKQNYELINWAREHKEEIIDCKDREKLIKEGIDELGFQFNESHLTRNIFPIVGFQWPRKIKSNSNQINLNHRLILHLYSVLNIPIPEQDQLHG